jgi:hypothetical protein
MYFLQCYSPERSTHMPSSQFQISAPSTHLTLLDMTTRVILARSTNDGAQPHVADISNLL